MVGVSPALYLQSVRPLTLDEESQENIDLLMEHMRCHPSVARVPPPTSRVASATHKRELTGLVAGNGWSVCRQARAAGLIKSCELLHKKGQWHVSVTLACANTDVKRTRTSDESMGADWGVNRLLTIVRTGGVANGTHTEVREDIDNPRWYQADKDKQIRLAQAVSRKKKYSKNWRKACAVSARFKAKQARKRYDHQHQVSAQLAARAAIFATEALTIQNMTASAAGTLEEPGTNVAQKSGLNREILDTAPAALLQKIAYKVSETGGEFLEAPTRRLKPSQTCPACGVQKKKTLSQRIHLCTACGHTEDRDAASARVALRWALGTLTKLIPEKVRKISVSCGQELPEAG